MDRAFLEGLIGPREDAEQVMEAILAKHKDEVDALVFDGVLRDAIRQAGGRNEKAVVALLDVAAIRASEDPGAAAQAAVLALKKEQDYLFAAPAPRYAAGTGTGDFRQPAPQTLAEALKEKFGR